MIRIKTYTNNKKILKIQAYHTEVLEQLLIKRTWIKQAQTEFNWWKNGEKGGNLTKGHALFMFNEPIPQL